MFSFLFKHLLAYNQPTLALMMICINIQMEHIRNLEAFPKERI
jgi:hypothetical protein